MAVGASRMKPRVRASRSQLHRKAPPLPLPPCIATTSGQARDGVVIFRHIEREGAARAGRAADMHHADLLAHRIERRELGEARRILARRRLEEELADRPQDAAIG